MNCHHPLLNVNFLTTACAVVPMLYIVSDMCHMLCHTSAEINGIGPVPQLVLMAEPAVKHRNHVWVQVTTEGHVSSFCVVLASVLDVLLMSACLVSC